MNKQTPIYLIPNDLNLLEVSILDAAKLVDTPFFLYDFEKIKKNWNQLKSIIPENTSIYYSVKANPNICIINIFKNLGAYFEIASYGELLALEKNNIDTDKIIFVGPGKSDYELRSCNKFTLVVESKNEIERLNTICQFEKLDIILRLNPKQSHGILSMGGNTQFGMDYEEICSVVERRGNYPKINILGIHGYLGTGILDKNQIINNSMTIIEIVKLLELKYNYFFRLVDIGGGLGIPYFEGDRNEDWSGLRTNLAQIFNILQGNDKRQFAVESGRFLVGSAGVFVTKVLDIKKKGDSIFVIVNGGINNLNYDNRFGFRPPPFKVLTKNTQLANYSICGTLCTPADRFAHETYSILPSIGDFIVFYQAGAYGLTAATTMFLSHDTPPEILLKNEKLSIIRSRMNSSIFIENQLIV